jgi:two-component sensor histidine kinase
MANHPDEDLDLEMSAQPLSVRPRMLVTAEDVLRAQKHSLELLVRGAPVAEVLSELIQVAEDCAPEGLAAILTYDENGRLRTTAANSLPAAFADAIGLTDLGSFGLPAGAAVTAVTLDIATDPKWSEIRPLAQALGIEAAWSHPIMTRDGKVVGAFNTYFRERRRPSSFELRLVETLSQTAALAISHQESEAAMARQRHTLDLAMEAAEMGAWRYTVHDNICLYDARSQRLYGLTDGRFLHDEDGVNRMIHADDIPGMWAAVAKAIDPLGDGRYNVDYRVRQLDGSWRWLSAWGVVEFQGEGPARRPVAITGASRDLTSAKLAEEHQRLLVNELNHRVKNTLATVQAISYMTLRNAAHLDEARHSLEGRIVSLARAHDLLIPQNWAGADLVDVVARSLAAFANEQCEVDGPSVKVSPKQALALSMALHELATNASKYGALAVPSGRVRLAWEIRSEALTLTWRESGGRPVETPTRRGFGSRLLENGLARELSGETTVDYAPTGIVCTITAPLS